MKLKCRNCDESFANLPDWRQHNRDKHYESADFDLETEDSDNIPKVDPTPLLADECKKLLDNQWSIIIYANALGSYTAMATKAPLVNVIDEFEERTGLKTCVLTDDFEPSAALYRLTEKVFGNVV